uniref:Carboxylic ester hydrolase n=2 Tax=Lygus hesperus TaxID=30085 RepID=A0A0A9X8C1_LYGHE
MWSLCVSTILLQGCISQNLDGPIVDTPQGRALGWERMSRDGRPYQAWTRIPYAQPPVGKLRFMPPKLAKEWTGTLNATADIPVCLQPVTKNTTTGSEDCLYLNVYRPKARSDQALPVLFYVHAGAYHDENIGPREIADYLMDEDVILVAIHYRVNFFGFMTLGDTIFPGNFGLKDQLTALRWVKKNIASFGGDPNSVTLFGQSSGGECVHQLLRSPLVEKEGLATRGVSDSGTINHMNSPMDADKARENTLNIIRGVGCDRSCSEEIRKCLQTVDAATLMEVYMDNYPTEIAPLPLAPVIEPEDAEDNVIPEDLSLRKSSKPWMTSTANGEGCLFMRMGYPSWFEKVRNNLTGYLESSIIDQHTTDLTVIREGARLLEKYYFPVMEPLENFTTEFDKMTGDNRFIYPYLFNIEKEKNNGPTWAFRNEYKGELSGISPSGEIELVDDVAGHADTIKYYFNKRSTFPSVSPIETPADKAVSKRLIKYLVNFANYSNPTPPGSPFIWEQYKSNEIMRLTKNGDFMADANYLSKLKTVLKLWSYAIGWK